MFYKEYRGNYLAASFVEVSWLEDSKIRENFLGKVNNFNGGIVSFLFSNYIYFILFHHGYNVLALKWLSFWVRHNFL